MQIDIIVEARMTSSRLPGKVMLTCMNKPLLELMVERLNKIDRIDNIIIATTLNETDDCIEELTDRLGIKCYRGSENDVLLRVLEAAECFGTDLIVEITGDDPLVDPSISSQVVKFFENNFHKYELVSNDIVNSVPLGFYTRAFKTTTLKKIESLTKNPIDRENPEAYFYNNLQKFPHYSIKLPKILLREDIRLTMDTKEDYDIIKNIYENFYSTNVDFTLRDIIKYLDANPLIKNINKLVEQKSIRYE